MQDSSYVETLIAVVDELYIRQAGPFGSIICDEALEEWKNQGRLFHHMHLPNYMEKLLEELPDKKLQVAFIESLQADEEISSHIAISAFLDNYL